MLVTKELLLEEVVVETECLIAMLLCAIRYDYYFFKLLKVLKLPLMTDMSEGMAQT
jgi:hypothetical protein